MRADLGTGIATQVMELAMQCKGTGQLSRVRQPRSRSVTGGSQEADDGVDQADPGVVPGIAGGAKP